MTGCRPVEMPTPSPDGALPTLNDYGGTSTKVHDYAQRFVELAASSPRWVLDVGCAYGAPAVAAIASGARVIANDLDERHLQIVRQQVPAGSKRRLKTRRSAFPKIRVPSGSIDAINCSAVLHFMDGPTVDRSARRMHQLLVPGGKIFIVTMTPFLKRIPSFAEEFDRRKRAGDRYPGYVDNMHRLLGLDKKPGERNWQINLFDTDVLSRPFAKAGFIIETVEYAKEINASISTDGRGAVALIARKP